MNQRKRLTTDRRKIFARESLTLMSMNKDELRQHYNEVFDRLQEYEVEEENSKTIELPCYIGDTVYVINGKAIKEAKIHEIIIDNSESFTMLVNFECDYECDKCPFDSWTQDYSGEYSCGGEYGESSITSSDFGEIAFLNKEEAAAKLAETE